MAAMAGERSDCSAFPLRVRACRFRDFFVTSAVVLSWLVPALGLLLALLALAWLRRVSRRLETLTQSYWELRYDYTRLRSQVARIDPEQPDDPPAAPQAPSQGVTFVPLSSMKKKNG